MGARVAVRSAGRAGQAAHAAAGDRGLHPDALSELTRVSPEIFTAFPGVPQAGRVVGGGDSRSASRIVPESR